MQWPLRRQILLPIVGVLLATVGIATALNAWLASARVIAHYDQQVGDISTTLSSTSFPLQSNVLRQIRGLTRADYVVIAENGQSVAASDESFVSAAENQKQASSRINPAAIAGVDNRRYFHVAVPARRAGAQHGSLVLHVFFSEKELRDARWQAVWPSLAIGAMSILIIAVIVSLIARRATGPLGDLHSQVNRVAQGEFRAMSVSKHDDEVRALAIAVNQMAERLAQYEDETRKSERLRSLGILGGGAAHQIRNAVTGCRIALDLHRRDELAAGNGHASEPLEIAFKQLAQIETSIQRLLALGKPPTTQRTRTDLAEVVREAVELVRPMASHTDIQIRTKFPQSGSLVEADAYALTQMVINLAVNAIEASAHSRLQSGTSVATQNGHIEIHLSKVASKRLELAIGNHGPGPSLAIQQHLFEPFATDKPGGTGLGLAVARRIADEHGGSIRWEQRGAMTWFLVTLPATE
jgi:signal transduction histidine kinase